MKKSEQLFGKSWEVEILDKCLPVSGETPREICVHKCEKESHCHNLWIRQEPTAAWVLEGWCLAGKTVGGSLQESGCNREPLG